MYMSLTLFGLSLGLVSWLGSGGGIESDAIGLADITVISGLWKNGNRLAIQIAMTNTKCIHTHTHIYGTAQFKLDICFWSLTSVYQFYSSLGPMVAFCK